jgi:hypothetical protein
MENETTENNNLEKISNNSNIENNNPSKDPTSVLIFINCNFVILLASFTLIICTINLFHLTNCISDHYPNFGYKNHITKLRNITLMNQIIVPFAIFIPIVFVKFRFKILTQLIMVGLFSLFSYLNIDALNKTKVINNESYQFIFTQCYDSYGDTGVFIHDINDFMITTTIYYMLLGFIIFVDAVIDFFDLRRNNMRKTNKTKNTNDNMEVKYVEFISV